MNDEISQLIFIKLSKKKIIICWNYISFFILNLRGILNVSEVNALTSEQFEWLFGNVVEMHLQNIKNNELHVAIQEIKKICNSRINHFVWSDI